MRLVFKNAQGQEKLVKANITEDKVFKCIKDYVHDLNPNFQIHYVRYWGEDPIVYDVGSHTEFFKLYKD
jgi:hypothetical protein